MKHTFSINQKDLLTVLASMLPICTKRTTLDTTASLLLQVRQRELIIKGTDLEIALQASCLLEESNCSEPVAFLVPGKRLHDVVKELDGIVHCTLTQGLLTLQAGKVTMQLNIGSGDQFPPFPERIENIMHIETEILIEMLRGAAFIIPQQHATAALTGLLWEVGPSGLVLTATDGHCLAQTRTAQYTIAQQSSWLIPRRAIIELQKLIELMKEKTIFVGICGKHVVFSGELFNFFTRLLVGTFPQYSAVLQRDSFVPARVDRQHLVKTLRRAASLLSGQFIATHFFFEPDQLSVTMQNKEVGNLQEQISVNGYEGESFEIRCYAPYMLHGLAAFQEEQVKLFLKSAKSPLIFTSERESGIGMTYLVMPVAPTVAAKSPS